MSDTELTQAHEAIASGDLIVYPTETVYGLGADALDPDAVEQVFSIKGRDRSKPLSMAVPDLETGREYVSLTEREAAFAEQFLPGPITLVVERRSMVPNVLTAGRERVGLRIPDHELSRSLADGPGPITATSANVSGTGSAHRVSEVDQSIRDDAAVVIDGGETPGGGSTVVDVSERIVHRRGANADSVERWLADEA
ncbi:L-threonylcarbamoyladenylate synthase [Halovenus rubra]|uniref:L-threonylcarbamoyladenylate synthase n=2 Tax=Halovenus rubra TaxID=869890 RepID=A0ABD5X289_9EURY|nr:L-threonylcarbamoyladenylate synthase [Halovenus rubra]